MDLTLTSPGLTNDLLLSGEFETEMSMETKNQSKPTDQKVEEGENVDENDRDDLETGEQEATLSFHNIIEKEFSNFINEIKSRRLNKQDLPDAIYEKTPSKPTTEVQYIVFTWSANLIISGHYSSKATNYC